MTEDDFKGGFRLAPEVHFRQFGDEVVLLDLARGEYFSLDALGARIWTEILAGQSAMAIVDLMARDYDVPCERLKADMLELLDELIDRGLLVFGS